MGAYIITVLLSISAIRVSFSEVNAKGSLENKMSLMSHVSWE